MSVQVSVGALFGKVIEFQYILCVGSRKELPEWDVISIMFQYILCVGSSATLKLFF